MSNILKSAGTLESPLNAREMTPIAVPGRALITLRLPFSDAEFKRLAAHLAKYPAAQVWFETRHMYDKTKYDLEFLRHFPFLRRLGLGMYGLTSLDGLAHVKRLQSLRVGFVESSRLSLAPLAGCRQLTSLKFDELSRDIEVLAKLQRLQELDLIRVKLPSLELLRGHPALQSLEITFGNTTDLAALPSLSKLRNLALRQVSGLADLAPLADARGLQCLWLQALAGVTRLPAMTKLKKLRRVQIDGLKRLTDLRPLATAPNLEDLWIESMPLQPAHFRPLIGHAKLRRVITGLGLSKRNEVENMLGIHDTPDAISQFKFRP